MEIQPQPIDSSHKPPVSITRLPASASIDEILNVIEQDGGLILTDFTSCEQLAAIDKEIEKHQERALGAEKAGIPIIPKETIVIPGLVGKSPTIAKICEDPILEGLRKEILEERFSVNREDVLEENTIDPLLSISVTLNIGYGAPRQRLHRDDNVHGIRHDRKFELRKQSQFGCLIAASKTTRQNGATMFIPGSHKWDDDRRPYPEEVCFAGEYKSTSKP